MLLELEERYTGVKIGSVSILHITVADDLALLVEDKADMQVMVWDADNNAGRERCCIHSTKSHTLWYNRCKKKDTELDVFMSGETVDITDSAVHLEIVRTTSGAVDVEGKITLDRNAVYSLMASLVG